MTHGETGGSWIGLAAVAVVCCLAVACGTTPSQPQAEPIATQAESAPTAEFVRIELVGRTLKRSIAVPKFDNATGYGRNRSPDDGETMGGRLAAFTSQRLAATQEFLPFDPAAVQDAPRTPYTVKGSLQRLGIMDEVRGRAPGVSMTGKAVAEVQLQVVSTATGQVVFEEQGRAERVTRVRGGQARLDDETARQLVSEAVGQVMDDLVEQLLQSPWSTSVLMLYGANCVISGGSALGLKVGDHLVVCERGPMLVDPAKRSQAVAIPFEVARIQIESSFGMNSVGEASICKVISGDLTALEPSKLVVQQHSYAAAPR